MKSVVHRVGNLYEHYGSGLVYKLYVGEDYLVNLVTLNTNKPYAYAKGEKVKNLYHLTAEEWGDVCNYDDDEFVLIEGDNYDF
jgi:hypothetical protein